MIDTGLVLARLLHYAAAALLAGVSFFPLYAYSQSEPADLRWRRMRLLLIAAAAALIGGLLWFVFAAANMSGSLDDVADPAMIWLIVQETTFGKIWAGRMALAVLIVVLAAKSSSRISGRGYLVMPILAAVLLGSLAGSGHAQMEEGWEGVVHAVADAAHLLAAGAWLGGLVPLGFILLSSATQGGGKTKETEAILMRFSGMGYVAVAILVGTGLVNSWFLVGSPRALLNMPDGQVLIGKLVLFAAMLGLAAANRFLLVPSMIAALPGAASRLYKHVVSEQLLGVLILLTVSMLGTMRPAIGH